MRVFFNHNLSSLSHIIEMMREHDRQTFIAVSHARQETKLTKMADMPFKELDEVSPGVMPDGYIDFALDVCRSSGAEIFMPYRHRITLSAYTEVFESHDIRLLTAGTKPVMEMIEDKPKLLALASSYGIKVSPHRVWKDASSLSLGIQELRDEFGDAVPLCIKPSRGIYGAGFRVLVDENAPGASRKLLNDYVPIIGIEALCRVLEKDPLLDEMMVMPFLAGPERSLDFTCLNGTLLGSVSRKKGIGHQRIYHDEELAHIAEILTRALDLSGILNLQTLENEKGEQCLLEINSRAAGGIGMTRHSGLNLAGVLLDGLSGSFPKSALYPQKDVCVAKLDRFEEI